MIPATASQTLGPFWHLIEDPSWADLTRFGVGGERVELTGTIHDGTGGAVTDAAVELWQSSPAASDLFPGLGRSRTDGTGRFRFFTVKPGPVAGLGNAQQAPHFALTIMARGLLHHLMTRVYFADEPLNDTDPVLQLIEDPRRRDTVIARPAGPGQWHIDIHLQGQNETVFMEV
jgi:protocatechuate 3,4-dioxygenase, alpha subunit